MIRVEQKSPLAPLLTAAKVTPLKRQVIPMQGQFEIQIGRDDLPGSSHALQGDYQLVCPDSHRTKEVSRSHLGLIFDFDKRNFSARSLNANNKVYLKGKSYRSELTLKTPGYSYDLEHHRVFCLGQSNVFLEYKPELEYLIDQGYSAYRVKLRLLVPKRGLAEIKLDRNSLSRDFECLGEIILEKPEVSTKSQTRSNPLRTRERKELHAPRSSLSTTDLPVRLREIKMDFQPIEIQIGRSTKLGGDYQLVYEPSKESRISRQHLRLVYDPLEDVLTAKNLSASNATFLMKNGKLEEISEEKFDLKKLPKDEPIVFYLGSKKNNVIVEFDPRTNQLRQYDSNNNLIGGYNFVFKT